MSLLHQNIVLVLNRNWQAINTTSPALALSQMCTDVATALDIDGRERMTPTTWTDWLKLPVRESDRVIGTVRGAIRVPAVIVLARFARVPMTCPKFSARTLWNRDEGRCQYTGKALAPGEGNIDHIVPRSRGGATSWENCVLVSREVNTRKANRTPEEAGLRLARKPVRPKRLPVTLTLRNHNGIPEWEHFLAAQ